MSITMETLAKVLIIAGLVQRYGALNVGLGLLAVSFAVAVLASIVTSYKIAKTREQMKKIGMLHTH